MSPYIGPSRSMPPPPVPILGGFDAWGLRQGADPWAGLPRFVTDSAPLATSAPEAEPAPAPAAVNAGSAGLPWASFPEFLRELLRRFGITPFAGGGQMTLAEPSTVVGNQTGTPYASLAEPDPMTGQPRPESLTVTPLGGASPQAGSGAAIPGGPTPFAMMMERLFTDLRTGKRRRTGSLRPVGATA